MKNCPECTSKLFKSADAEGVFRCTNPVCRKIFHILEIRVMSELEYKSKLKKGD